MPYSGYNDVNFGYIFRTDNVKNVSYMFSGCSSLENFYVYNPRPSEYYEDESYRITNAVGMLSNCTKLEDVNLDGVYINANASVFVTYAISVPAYSNMFTIYEDGNTRGNDNIKHIHIPEKWCYATMTSEISVQYNSVPLGSCGLASTYHDSNEQVLWLMGDASDPSSITYTMQNFTSNELGSWYYINKGPEQRQVKIYGDFYRATYSAAISPSSQRYDMDYYYAIYDSTGEQIDGGSTAYNIIA